MIYFKIFYNIHLKRYRYRLKKLFKKYELSTLSAASFSLFQGIYRANNKLCINGVDITTNSQKIYHPVGKHSLPTVKKCVMIGQMTFLKEATDGMDPNRKQNPNKNKRPEGDRPKNGYFTPLMIALVLVLVFSWVMIVEQLSLCTTSADPVL